MIALGKIRTWPVRTAPAAFCGRVGLNRLTNDDHPCSRTTSPRLDQASFPAFLFLPPWHHHHHIHNQKLHHNATLSPQRLSTPTSTKSSTIYQGSSRVRIKWLLV